MIFENERELVKAYLKKCEKQGYCEITQQSFSTEDFFTEFLLPGIGRIDLINFTFGFNPNDGLFYGIVDIYEFKNNRLCRDDVAQINRYYQGIKLLIEDNLGVDIMNRDTNININLYLIGRCQDFKLDTLLLIDTIPNLQIINHSIINGELELKFDVLPKIEYLIDTETKFYKCLDKAAEEWKTAREINRREKLLCQSS